MEKTKLKVFSDGSLPDESWKSYTKNNLLPPHDLENSSLYKEKEQKQRLSSILEKTKISNLIDEGDFTGKTKINLGGGASFVIGHGSGQFITASRRHRHRASIIFTSKFYGSTASIETPKFREVKVSSIFSRSSIDTKVEIQFEALLDKLFEEVGMVSLHKRIINNKYYKRIIGLDGVAPILFREFQKDPIFWYDALSNKVNHDISAEGLTTEEFIALWLKWGKENSYLI